MSCEIKEFKGVHFEDCPFNLGKIIKIYRAKTRGSFIPKASFGDLIALRTLVETKELIMSSEFQNATDNSNGNQFTETGYGQSVRTAKSNLSVDFNFNDAWCNITTMQEHWDGANGYVFLVDEFGRVFGRSEGDNLYPVPAALYADKKFFKISNDLDYSGTLTITMTPSDRDKVNAFVEDSSILEIDGIRLITAGFSNITATGFDVVLTSGCDNKEVEGLTDADFTISGGVSITSVTETSPGNYTFVTGTDPAGQTLSTAVLDKDPLFYELEATVIPAT